MGTPGIAGGLPFHAVKDITIQQQFLLEKAHVSNQPVGGFTLDLVKGIQLDPTPNCSTSAHSFWSLRYCYLFFGFVP